MSTPICAVDMDTAEYIGNEDDGAYVAVAGSGGAWYASVVVDCNTGHFTEPLVTDDGPYPTEKVARMAGRNWAKHWCIDNGIDYDGTTA